MTTKPSKTLSPEERAKLAECEAIIQQGIVNFVSTGRALLTVSDGRLYRENYSTFAEYVNDKYQMQAAHAYRLCEAAEVVKELEDAKMSPIGDNPVIPNEAQARELAKAPPGQRAEVLAEAVKTAPNGKVTAGHIKRTVAKKAGKPQDKHAWKLNGPAFSGWTTNKDGQSVPPEPSLEGKHSFEEVAEELTAKALAVLDQPAAPKRRPSVVDELKSLWRTTSLEEKIEFKSWMKQYEKDKSL